MKSYILTLAPEDGAGTTTTAHIDVNGDGPRVKRITFTAADGGYLPQMPFDIESFIATVMPATAPPATAALPPASVPAAQTQTSTAATATEPQIAAATEPDPDPTRPDRPARQAPAATKTAAAAQHATTSPAATKVTRPKKTTPGKKTAPAKKTTPLKGTDTHTERVYHRMPDDFVHTFGKTTMADLATIYQVPLHTVAGWAKTARRQNLIPPATPRKRA